VDTERIDFSKTGETKEKPFDPDRAIPKEILRVKVEEHKQWHLDHGFTKQEAIENANWLREQVGLEDENEKYNPLEFPSIIGQGPAWDFAELYSRYLEVPSHFLFLAYLVCLGSVLSKSIKLHTELDIEPRLFVLLLGESSDVRKSTALRKTVEFFKETITEFKVCWGVNSAEGLSKVLKNGMPALLCLDEFQSFLGKAKIENSVLLPMVTTLFEGFTFESHTKTSDIVVEDAHLSLLAASTEETHAKTWDPAFTAIGFSNRLWIVPGYGEKKFAFPKKIPDSEKQQIKAGLIETLRAVGGNLELDMTPDAEKLFQDWYLNCESSVHVKRLEGYALRFMALFCANECKSEIDVEIVERVITLCDWQLEVRRIYDPIDADNTIAEMEERVRRYLRQGELTERELKRKLHRIIERSGTWCFINAMKNLRTAREIYYRKNEKAVFIGLSE